MEEKNIDEMEGMSKKEMKAAKKEAQRQAARAEARSKTMRSAMIWGGTLLVLVLGVWGLTKVSGPETEQPTLSTTEVASSDHTKGAVNAPITIIEYSDFQCPACKQYAPVVRQVVENYPDDVRFVYRHFPLRQIHDQAQAAAEAAEAAGMQGMFFEFHDILFENQGEWVGSNATANTKFLEYAALLELDVDQFKEDMNSAAARDKVNNDSSSGTQSGLSGTPSFFVNGQRINNPRGFEPFRQLIDAELERISASAIEINTEDIVVEVVDEEVVVDEETEDGTDTE
ncbi:DsbA family protein [Candidatus Uhrbacteria bacterium]|nr:DsbA family protein [Candidatus Uhrbacteria bacterium]